MAIAKSIEFLHEQPSAPGLKLSPSFGDLATEPATDGPHDDPAYMTVMHPTAPPASKKTTASVASADSDEFHDAEAPVAADKSDDPAYLTVLHSGSSRDRAESDASGDKNVTSAASEIKKKEEAGDGGIDVEPPAEEMKLRSCKIVFTAVRGGKQPWRFCQLQWVVFWDIYGRSIPVRIVDNPEGYTSMGRRATQVVRQSSNEMWQDVFFGMRGESTLTFEFAEPAYLGSYTLATAVSSTPGSDPSEWTLSGRTKDGDELVLDVAKVVPPPSTNYKPVPYSERFVMGMCKGRMERNATLPPKCAYPHVDPYSDTPAPRWLDLQMHQKRALDQCNLLFVSNSTVRLGCLGVVFFVRGANIQHSW
jgi:hypothetical protein